MVGTKVYKTAFSGILSSGGLLHSDWLPPNRVIAHYHEVDLISTLLDALTVQNSPRRSRRSSPPAHIENEWLPATLTLSPPAVWTHSNNVFYGFSSVKCGTSGILPVSWREQNEVDDFSKSTSRLKSTNRDSSKWHFISRSMTQPAEVTCMVVVTTRITLL